MGKCILTCSLHLSIYCFEFGQFGVLNILCGKETEKFKLLFLYNSETGKNSAFSEKVIYDKYIIQWQVLWNKIINILSLKTSLENQNLEEENVVSCQSITTS